MLEKRSASISHVSRRDSFTYLKAAFARTHCSSRDVEWKVHGASPSPPDFSGGLYFPSSLIYMRRSPRSYPDELKMHYSDSRMDCEREKENVKVHHRLENYAGHNFTKWRGKKLQFLTRILINLNDCEIKRDLLIQLNRYNDFKSWCNSRHFVMYRICNLVISAAENSRRYVLF